MAKRKYISAVNEDELIKLWKSAYKTQKTIIQLNKKSGKKRTLIPAYIGGEPRYFELGAGLIGPKGFIWEKHERFSFALGRKLKKREIRLIEMAEEKYKNNPKVSSNAQMLLALGLGYFLAKGK